MRQVVIENPIINAPFDEPTRHFRFADEGITNEVVDGRRTSSYFVPIAKPKKKGSKQLQFDTEWTQDRIEENKLVNDIRRRIALWRKGGYVGVTPTTARLIAYWTDTNREKKLFFCQNEALETAIYITEVAKKYGDTWIENAIREANDTSNPGLPRTAFKMATGSGKTVVMAMLIAWHTLNKRANPQDARFTDTFLIVTPGITIRDRLRVLLPNDPENYYRQRDIIPAHDMEKLGQAKIVITNFHAFQLREKVAAGKLTKSILADGETSAFTETPDQMVRRVCRELGTKKNIVVLNDEAHHCYRRKPDGEHEKLAGDDRVEAKNREAEARIWISGIEAVKAKIGVKAIYDLSATPFFLRGSGYPEGTLFPWVVSDFSLIDAIEAGIVKVPRVPVADDSMTGEQPTYRDLWLRIREHLPRKGRKTDKLGGEPNLPVELQGALLSLYGNYEKYYRLWEQNAEACARGITPPVFIVVCNNTNVSKLVFDFIAGWEKQIGEQTIVQAGQLQIFRNDDGNGAWLHRPNTILVDSQQLESGESMSNDFKKIAAREIDEFKADYRTRFPGRDAENLTDEDLLREVMNTVGKAGKLGEHVKCVVSVSMLTEGWDANTVTHVLGVRAFGTQLLCEQVVGRALRRKSYAANEHGHFNPEYAEVYGVPFSFIPCSGATVDPKPGPLPTRVRALESRIACEITFPRLLGYRYDVAGERLNATFTDESKLVLSTADIPTKTENAPIVGESSIHTLDDLKRRRPNEVVFLLAKLTLEKYFRDDDGNDKPWLFPQLLDIAKRWLAECMTLKDNTFPQLLLLIEFAHDAADRIYKAIVASTDGTAALKPILRPYDTLGSTRYVDFDTTRPVFATREDKCHISHVVADTDSWEQKMAEALEDMSEVIRYVKNHNLGFTIPYTLNGEEKDYIPDFIACIDDGHGPDDLLNLIIEVTGEKRKDKAAKVATARTLWVPAINNHGSFGRWAFLEIDDPWDAKNIIHVFLKTKEL
ncbi:MAG: restriction endonuclease subunit R [Candidatus Aquicultor secundus]|nr:DEAD/DEAH box helicase family protein [Candidatus Aquicultor secundus]NCO65805.1 DEAD/DEAH box helicase family protein [Solirubrobacter sp.]OIO87509.1 MAG: restriction endonuclease subunit R [Candidatus Aquicultor secundus]PIU27399.1 MAG: restriction endonuclease subunit R [Candidatus Aquicultor secundus]PIW21614.1 MAG: restriction endonuclease subunit R [Candidatus Aquicultor secundus]PJB79198.1 MAG: restriction endonuclease subunit R [Candidatus Aquicultor secundus]